MGGLSNVPCGLIGTWDFQTIVRRMQIGDYRKTNRTPHRCLRGCGRVTGQPEVTFSRGLGRRCPEVLF